jgi:hypothetical protein
LKVPDQSAGKMVKCPKCSNAISVPLTGNEQLPATPPAAAAPPPSGASALTSAPAADAGPGATGDDTPKKSKKGLYIGLGIGAVLLLSCCCLGGGGGIGGYFMFFNVEKNEKVTKANFDKLKKDMTLADIEKVLGPARATTTDDVKTAYKGKGSVEMENSAAHSMAAVLGTDYCWRNGDDFIFATFNSSPKTDPNAKAVSIEFTTSGQTGVSRVK